MVDRTELIALVYKLKKSNDESLDAFNKLMALDMSIASIWYWGGDDIIIIKKEDSITVIWDVIYERIECDVFWLEDGFLMTESHHPFELIEHLIMTNPTLKTIPEYDHNPHFDTESYEVQHEDRKLSGYYL